MVFSVPIYPNILAGSEKVSFGQGLFSKGSISRDSGDFRESRDSRIGCTPSQGGHATTRFSEGFLESGVAPANQTKKRSVHELFAGAFRNKISM